MRLLYNSFLMQSCSHVARMNLKFTFCMLHVFDAAHVRRNSRVHFLCVFFWCESSFVPTSTTSYCLPCNFALVIVVPLVAPVLNLHCSSVVHMASSTERNFSVNPSRFARSSECTLCKCMIFPDRPHVFSGLPPNS